jgi:hypothetical protein
MKSWKALRAANDRALKEVERAKREIAKLRRALKAGTLDARTADSGLLKVQKYVCEIPNHVPHFKATSNGDQ